MKNNILFSIINICCLLWTCVSLSGFALYKYRSEIMSWEEGVKRAITLGIEWLHEEATGEISSDKVINSTLILTKNETLELTQMFNRHPYETPVLKSYTPNINGISWYDIEAISLTQRYSSMQHNDIKKIAEHIIQTYFMKTRNTQVTLFIRVASPTRLYFAIPLSIEGCSSLTRMNNDTLSQFGMPSSFSNISKNPMTSDFYGNLPKNSNISDSCDYLEEDINIFED